jgi:glycosyltransferase involved in cell wall biosynthesis
MRIAVLSQFHPEIVSGGAERAAYSLFQALRGHPSVSFAALVSPVSPQEIGHAARFGAYRSRPDEIVVSPPAIDPFTFESSNVDELFEILATLVRYLRLDVVHAHHFLSWGIETFEILKKLKVRTVLTLHEFMLICNHFGQMLTPEGRLCDRASPVDCGRCFPAFAAGKFFIRSEVIKRALADVDHFIAPSQFLAARFIEWGLASERISVIENCVDAAFLKPGPARPPASEGCRKTVFGFFGNWNPFKGVDILLEAYGLLPEDFRAHTELRLFGVNRYWTGGKFEQRLQELLSGIGRGVIAHGPYRNADALRLMSACDWVVVPSIWWENSPLVIQEAKRAGCRILCSDIGGMREKIELGTDLTFATGSPAALAEAMLSATALPRSTEAQQRRNRRRFREEEQGKVEEHLRICRPGSRHKDSAIASLPQIQ